MCSARIQHALLAAEISKLVRRKSWAQGLALASRQISGHQSSCHPKPAPPTQLLVISAAVGAISQSIAWMKALCLLPCRLQPDVVLCNATAAACGRASQWQRSLHMLANMCVIRLFPDSTSLNILISACGRALEWRLALALVSGMRKLPKQRCQSTFCDAKGIGAAVEALGRTGRWFLALSLLHEMQSRRVSLSIGCFNSAISAAGRSGQWLHAVQCLESISHLELTPTAITKGTIINVLGNAGLWQLSLSALGLHKFRSVAAKRNDPGDALHLLSSHVNLTMLNSSLSACGRASRWELAQSLLHAMPCMGVVPDSISVAAVAAPCATVMKWKHSLQLCLQIPSARASVSLEAAAVSTEHFLPRMASLQILRSLLHRLSNRLTSRPPRTEQEFGAALLAWNLLNQTYVPKLSLWPASCRCKQWQSFLRLHHRRVAAQAWRHLESIRLGGACMDDIAGSRFVMLQQVYDLGPELSKISLESLQASSCHW